MRASQWFTATMRQTPNDAEIISHQLMLRAGMIRKLGSGLYNWLPLGLKILRKVETIVREEMHQAQALEILMPAVQPAELWQETKRWETFGNQLLKIVDNNQREYCFGPTHEEVITDWVRQELTSYKQLPVNFYQIQTKFRDEIRPRFGVMRAREFLMKDAYSFHTSIECLAQTYDKMFEAYKQILTRLGLKFRAVEADTGAIGGFASHEFQVLAQAGEDCIFFSDSSDYAANIEQATSLPPHNLTVEPVPELEISEDIKPAETLPNLVKIHWVVGQNAPFVALVLQACDTLNVIKAEKHALVRAPLTLVDDNNPALLAYLASSEQTLLKLNAPLIVDTHAQALAWFSYQDKQNTITHIKWQRDVSYLDVCDLRNVKEGDRSPDGQGILQSARGIEVGHIFQLGDKYAKAMQACVLNEHGQSTTLMMGCYGLGISRIVAAAIEQHHDDKGIKWPPALAPFDMVIIPINAQKSDKVTQEAQALYNALQEEGFDVLLDDRNERAGVLFADNELIGIPHRLVISEKLLVNEEVEYKSRHLDEVSMLKKTHVVDFFKKLFALQKA